MKKKKVKSVFGKGDATQIIDDAGRVAVLLNPSQKGAKAAAELRDNKRYTNDGKVKQNYLTRGQKRYRSGYLASRSDSADVYLAKNNPEKLIENKEHRRIKRQQASELKSNSRNERSHFYSDDELYY